MGNVAVVQLNSGSNIQDNLLAIEKYFISAKDYGVELISLPENFSFIGKTEVDKLNAAEKRNNGYVQQHISYLSKKYGIWTIAGTIPILSNASRINASCFVYDSFGDVVTCYNKIHLFDVSVSDNEEYKESAVLDRGTEVVVVDTPIGCVGLSICYDLRFPELYRQMVVMGAEIFVVSSAFTLSTGTAHWSALLQARAIENLCYVLAPNQCGTHENGRSTYGHSMIVDPWGRILLELEDAPGMIVYEIDLARQKQIRQNFPCNEHHVL